jgi:hypothetical protein
VKRTCAPLFPSINLERGHVMFSAIYDKADWGVGVLLLAAIVCLVLV